MLDEYCRANDGGCSLLRKTSKPLSNIELAQVDMYRICLS
ncbi:MAG: hypothetical protein ACI9LU_001360 [Polaribacter sp.]|jgi:hypothetical protein